MNTRTFLAAAGAIIMLSAFTISSSVNWEIKDNFSIKFAGTDAEGVFKSLEGNIQFDEAQAENSSFSFTVDVSSINTGNGMKNKHAVSDKWFDADQYPNITFNSSAVAVKEGKYEVTGEMQIHGVKKQMTIPFDFNDGVFTSSFSVNRLDFGVGTMKGPSKKVSNQIDLEVSIPVTK